MFQLFADLFKDKQSEKEWIDYLNVQVEKNKKYIDIFSGVLRKNLDRYLKECEIGNVDARVAIISAHVESMVSLRVLREILKSTGADMEKSDLVMIDFIRNGENSDYFIKAKADAKKYG